MFLPVALLAASCGDADGASPAAEAPGTTRETADTAPADTGPETTDTARETADTAPETTDTPPTETTDPAPPTTNAPAEPVAGGDRSSPIVQLAIADLADRLGIEGADEVIVLLAEDVTWRNGSLGCPEPGMSYTQALVDGFRVILAVDGIEYAYHSGRGQEPFLCETPSKDGTTTAS